MTRYSTAASAKFAAGDRVTVRSASRGVQEGFVLAQEGHLVTIQREDRTRFVADTHRTRIERVRAGEHERDMRQAKVVTLTQTLRAAGATADAVEKFDEDQWNLTTAAANQYSVHKMRVPSLQSRIMIVAALREIEKRTAGEDIFNAE